MPSAQSPRPILTPYALDALPSELTGGVVVIGNFDGVHRGHAALLDAARVEARRRRVPAVVLTFEPHPRTFFKPDPPVFRVTPLPAKARLLSALGLDGIVVASFDRAFADHSPDDFAEKIIAGRLKAAAGVVGHDFRYGKARAGTAETLAAEGARLGFPVEILSEVVDEAGRAVSSSAVRHALAAGEIAEANRVLGYRWFAVGEVIAGDRRGRELGFPTANLRLAPDCRLRHGIYAVTVGRRGRAYGAVASYGRRPTFDNGPPLLEVYLFDFSGDLYGEELTVTFLDWIRRELRFDSVEALIAAMRRDAEAARGAVDAAGPGTPLDRSLAALSPREVVGEGPIG